MMASKNRDYFQNRISGTSKSSLPPSLSCWPIWTINVSLFLFSMGKFQGSTWYVDVYTTKAWTRYGFAELILLDSPYPDDIMWSFGNWIYEPTGEALNSWHIWPCDCERNRTLCQKVPYRRRFVRMLENGIQVLAVLCSREFFFACRKQQRKGSDIVKPHRCSIEIQNAKMHGRSIKQLHHLAPEQKSQDSRLGQLTK